MIVLVGIIILLIISFFWAYSSLKKELKKAIKKEHVKKIDIGHDINEEIVLFDRTTKE